MAKLSNSQKKIRNRFEPVVAHGQKFNKVQSIHGYYFDEEKKKRVFGVVGEINTYEDIQSHLCECDMDFIKSHLLENGTDVIDESLMADVSAVAPDLLSNLTNAHLGQDLFKSLPMKVREKYGNDIYRFASEYKPTPTEQPTPAPTEQPTPAPTEQPTPAPTEQPTPAPTEQII